MAKRIIALILCLFTLVAVLASCAGSISPTAEYKGEQVTMYLSENIYDLDPARAYKNESTKSIVSMLFGTLFVLDENGKVQPSLAESYTTEEKNGEYYMYITIADTYWSDNTPVTADDVVFAWKRLLNPNNSFEAAALLYDIKGARAYSKNEVSKDDIGITADQKRLTIQFEGKIDYEHFILNLTSLALAPLREDVVAGVKGEDWAKKPGTMVCSGPFKLARISFSQSKVFYDDTDYDTKVELTYDDGSKEIVYVEGDEVKAFRAQYINSFVLERNSYYFRNSDKNENLDVSVTPYRILVDCAMSDEDIQEAYEGGTILYIGDIPMSLRETYKDEAIYKDSLSTTTIYMNQNVELFTNKAVRQALSMAIDRTTLAKDLVFADAATGIVPTGVFNTGSNDQLFRDNSSNDFAYLKTDEVAAQKLLEDAGIDATQYSFTFTYAAYDEVHTYMAEEIAKAWSALGFTVTLNPRATIANNDYYKFTDSIPDDICDDLYAQDLATGNFEVILLDLVAPSADPFSVLAPFAKEFSGQTMDMSDPNNYKATTHVTGYDSQEYDAEIEKAFNEKTIANRAEALHAAEAILMEDMPVIPVVFNKSACLVNDGLKLNNTTLWWKNGSNYYVSDTLAWITVDNYDEYLVTCSNFLESKFESYKMNPDSYFSSYEKFSFEEFKGENSNYAYLWKVYDITAK